METIKAVYHFWKGSNKSGEVVEDPGNYGEAAIRMMMDVKGDADYPGSICPLSKEEWSQVRVSRPKANLWVRPVYVYAPSAIWDKVAELTKTR